MIPRLAPHFTVVADDRAVWLVAGEDVRYRLDTGGDPAWLRDALDRCDGATSLARVLDGVPAAHRADADEVLRGLYSERVLVDGTARDAHVSVAGARVVGDGALAVRLREGTSEGASEGKGTIEMFAQDTLHYGALLAHNTTAIAERRRWMWVTTGPASRAYVGPLFVPGAGPCAACLLVHFKRLSPVPELYDALIAHRGAFAPAVLPAPAIALVAALARYKLALAAEPVAPAALYALHVVELVDLTVSSHEPIADPECDACRR